MSRQLIQALGLIKDDLDRCGVRLKGIMPPLLTLSLSRVEDEARYHSYVRHQMTCEELLAGHLKTLRPDCLCSISGIEMRLSSDQRIDEAVRRLFK